MLGDLTGFGISYFDFDNTGYVKTAMEVSSDNSPLMRVIARHGRLLEGSLANLFHVLLHMSRSLGRELADEDEKTAKALVEGLGV